MATTIKIATTALSARLKKAAIKRPADFYFRPGERKNRRRQVIAAGDGKYKKTNTSPLDVKTVDRVLFANKAVPEIIDGEDY